MKTQYLICIIHKLVYLGFDLNYDNEISFDEGKKIQTLIIPPSYLEDEITDLSGIEYFVNLDTFSCISHKLEKVNLNKNLKLQYLNLSGNYDIETIQIDSLSILSHLDITNIGYNIDTINLTHLTHLKELYIDYKSKLNISNNPELEILDAIHIPGINVSQNLMLRKLTCSNITSIDLSQNRLLESFSCVAFGTDSTDGLKILDLSNNLILKELDCSQNYLTHLDLTNNSKLEKLTCSNNPLKKLGLSKNTKLKMLRCLVCKLDSLNISNNKELTLLNCHFNKIKKLNTLIYFGLHCPASPILRWFHILYCSLFW